LLINDVNPYASLAIKVRPSKLYPIGIRNFIGYKGSRHTDILVWWILYAYAASTPPCQTRITISISPQIGLIKFVIKVRMALGK
ncbi:MAG: hypothetical protein P8105_02240, partial [Dehalococcoidia bacterium]